MSRAVDELKALSGVAFFEAHRAAGPSAAFVQAMPDEEQTAESPPDASTTEANASDA